MKINYQLFVMMNINTLRLMEFSNSMIFAFSDAFDFVFLDIASTGAEEQLLQQLLRSKIVSKTLTAWWTPVSI